MSLSPSTTHLGRSRSKRRWSFRVCIPALVVWLGCAAPAPALAAASASAEDYAREKSRIAELTASSPNFALAAVESVRGESSLTSSLSSNDLDVRLARLLEWMARDYGHSGDLRLLSAAPDGLNAAGRSNARLQTLQHTYWLQDNSLYGAGALLEYVPSLGRLLNDSWRSKWEEKFPKFCPDTESDVVVGVAPAYDGGEDDGDPRCRLPRPGVWQMMQMRQYPRPADKDFDSLPAPIIGADYPGDETGGGVRMQAIGKNATRDLLKYGCLRQVILGNREAAEEMFDLALAQWDGNGFLEPKSRGETDAASGMYWTRDLAFAIMCANALGQGGQSNLGSKVQVPKASIEQKLWANQSPTGGVWTNYCSDGARSDACGTGPTPASAKQTNEIAPLVLLAYGRNIWLKPKPGASH